MAPQEFLAAVLPPPGYGKYCVAELSTKQKKHVFVDELEAAVKNAESFNARKLNTYFALATYETPKSREASNARWMKSFFIDIDAYTSARDAVQALLDFIDATGLRNVPKPLLVSSGHGVHAYWPLVEPISITQWKPVAERLKKLASEQGFNIDFTVTADAARVLRVPGTMNWKDQANPRPCVVKDDGEGPTTLDAFASAVGYNSQPASNVIPFVIPGVKPKAADSAVGLKLLQNSAVSFRTLLDQARAGEGCGQLRFYAEHASDEGLEPLWRGILSIAKACEVDGLKGAKLISSLHPYDEERMNRKLREIKGPYPCTKFNSENPGVCEACPSWGKITNPLGLARQTRTDNTPKVVELAPEIEHDEAVPTAVSVNRPPPPRGYAYGASGGVYVEVTDKADPEARPTLKLILPYDFFVVKILNQANEHHVHMVAMRPEGPQPITLLQRSTVAQDDLCKALAFHNVMAANLADAHLYRYVRACVEEASANSVPLKVPSQYGWQEDDSFVYNGRIMSPGKEVITPLPGLDNILRVTKPAGTLEGWQHTVKLLIKYRFNEILAMMTVGFGAPLMRFTSFDGLTFHIGSSESGTGKSVALEMAASIWGHPTRYMVGKDTSGVAMQQRLGLLNSLPLICDEITQKNRNNFEWFPGFVFDMTDGKGKERMEGGSNKERVNTTYWSTLALVSSNTHVMDYLSSRKHSSQGEIMRLLELKMSKRLDVPPDLAIALKDMLPHNYGMPGAKFIRYVVDNQSTTRQVVRSVEEKLQTVLQRSPEERFWIAGVAASLAGGIIAGSQYANVIDLPIQAIQSVFSGIVDNARGVSHTSKREADDVLNSYIREFYGKFVVVRKKLDGVSASLGDNKPLDESLTRTEVCGRVEIGFQPGRNIFFVEEQLLKKFCASMSFGYSDFKAQMGAKYNAHSTKKDLLHGTRGPTMNVNVLKMSIPSQGGGDVEASSSLSVA